MAHHNKSFAVYGLTQSLKSKCSEESLVLGQKKYDETEVWG